MKKETLDIIKRLESIDYSKKKHINRSTIQRAFDNHLRALNQPIRKVRLLRGLNLSNHKFDDKYMQNWSLLYNTMYNESYNEKTKSASNFFWDKLRLTLNTSALESLSRLCSNNHYGSVPKALIWAIVIEEVLTDCVPYQKLKEVESSFIEAYDAGAFMYCIAEQEIIVVTQPVMQIKNNKLHCDNGPAVDWGKEKYFFLNGVRMNEEQVLITSEQMTPEFVMKEENAECRKELVRKFGIDRLKTLGKVVDKKDDYELLDMSSVFLGLSYAPHLLMKNPSVPGVFHLEGVSPDCKTVEHAINWRRYRDINKTWVPEILT